MNRRDKVLLKPDDCIVTLRSVGREIPAFLATAVLVVWFLAPRLIAQDEGKVQIDPQTGRAIGAKEMSPEELKRLFDAKGKVLIIDVRDAGSFEKETVKGAIHIPLNELPYRLKDIPRDTTLVFT
jgi:hypothetical protein